MLIVGSEEHRAHDAVALEDGVLGRSPESPERVDAIRHALESAGHRFTDPVEVEPELLHMVHTTEFVELLSTAWQRWADQGHAGDAAMGFAWPARGLPAPRPDDLAGQLGFHSFSSDTSLVAGTWPAALASASIAVTAADLLVSEGSTTYGLCRPPGHHATVDQFGGYCYLNNAALAAQRLLDLGAGRVAVLDVDYHHGNGTQSIFYGRRDVLFVSIHADPRHEFPWYAGHAEETGVGDGSGWTLNLPLALGADSVAWSAALDTALGALGDRGVDALVVSLGVDAHERDPLGTFHLTTADFAAVGLRLASLGLPTVVVQEGGYSLNDVGSAVAAFLEPFDS